MLLLARLLPVRVTIKSRAQLTRMRRIAGVGGELLAAIANGCDCVVNLAAGFDTRPYRLDLPPSLPWIEADLPPLIEEKERLLADARPRCRLRRIKVDLVDSGARASMLQDALGSSTQALVITEGLLVYLEDAQVRALSADLFARSGVRSWILDLASPELIRMMHRSMGTQLDNAPMKFGPPNGVAYFEAMGWSVAEVRSILHAVARFRRLPRLLRLFALFPEADPRKLGRARWSAVVQLDRSKPRNG
jgi:methyltransferase (TIGR00027 family)